MTPEPRMIIYVLSATVGVIGGGFGMLMFMFTLIEAQASIGQQVDDHLEEWHEYQESAVRREQACMADRKEMRKMLYEIREQILRLNGKRNLP